MKAFVINRNQLHFTAKMADWLAVQDGVTPIIIDNNSDYPPLLEWYDETAHTVVRLRENLGSPAVFTSGVLDQCGLQGGFIITDPDLDTSELPLDWINELQTGLDTHQFANKSGVSLKIDDLPDTILAQRVKDWERPHWAYPLDGGRFFKASIATTLCLCRDRQHLFDAVRAAPPYTVRHIPWYWETKDDIPDDMLYYHESIGNKWNYWSKMMKKEYE